MLKMIFQYFLDLNNDQLLFLKYAHVITGRKF
jgi:hypothetical protein